MAQYPFKACIRIYGIPYEKAERTRDGLFSRLNPLFNEIGLQAQPAPIDEEYNHEFANSEPVIVFHFEQVASSASVLADLHLFLSSLARLLDAHYSDIRVDCRTDL